MSGQDQPIHQIARSGDVQALRQLLDRDPQLAFAKGWFDRMPLHCAAASGVAEAVQLVIGQMVGRQAQGQLGWRRLAGPSALVDVRERLHNWTPLFETVIQNSLDCTQLLLAAGANPNARSARHNRRETPLFYAQSLEMVLLLQRYGAALNIRSAANQYAFEASGWRSPELLQFWLDQGVEVNHRPGFRSPLLHSLIRAYEPVGLPPPAGRSIASLASLSLLLDSGADPNLPDPDQNETALHLAVTAKRSDIARLLLSAGANPNAQSRTGDTPLHYAAQGGEVELAQLLLEAGADANLRNLYRRSAWDNAQAFPPLRTLLQPSWRDLPNPRPTPQQLINRILAIPSIRAAGLSPCSEAEIRHLEQKFGVILPAAYKQFLRTMGRGAGGFLSTDHWNAFYADLETMAQSQDYAAEFAQLPPCPPSTLSSPPAWQPSTCFS